MEMQRLKMFQLQITILILLLLLSPMVARATVIDFEDTNPGRLADGYSSLHWSNVFIGHSSGLLSGNVGYGSHVSIYTGPFEYFNLISLEIASESVQTVWVEAYTFSDRVFLEAVDIDEFQERLLDLNLMGITRLNMWVDGNATFFMDNIKVTWLCGSCDQCGQVEGSGHHAGSLNWTPTVHPPTNNPPPVWPPARPPGVVIPRCPPPDHGGEIVPPICPPPEPPPPAPVPEPSTWLLVGSGLALLAGFRKKSKIPRA